MKKNIKLVIAIILLVTGISLIPVTYAATKSSITVNSNIDGNKFFKMIKNTKDDKDIYVKIKNTAELANFADELYYASNISYDYEVETPETEHTLKNGKVKLLYSTADIKEMETGKLVFDPDSDTGKDFLKALHKSKADSKIRLRIAADNKKDALKQLKKFQKEVKSASEFGLSYEIYTVENVKQLDRCQDAAIYIDFVRRTSTIFPATYADNINVIINPKVGLNIEEKPPLNFAKTGAPTKPSNVYTVIDIAPKRLPKTRPANIANNG